MNKTPNRYAFIIRIITYILMPICVISFIASVISVVLFMQDGLDENVDSYFESISYTSTYMNSVMQNLSTFYNRHNEYYGEYIDEEYVLLNSYEKSEELQINYIDYLIDKNFKFLIINNDTNIAYTNIKHTMKSDTIEQIKNELANNNYYWNYEEGNINTNIQSLSLENIKYDYNYINIETNYNCTIYTSMNKELKYIDDYYINRIVYETAIQIYKLSPVIIILSMVIGFTSLIVLGIFTGKKKGEEEIYLNWVDKIPLEIVTGALFIVFIFAIAFTISIFGSSILEFIVAIISLFAVYVILVILFETFAKRIKSKTLLKNTLVNITYKWIKKVIKNILNNFNLVVTVSLLIALLMIATAIFANMEFIGFLILIALWAIISRYLSYRVKKFLKVKEALKQLYEGNTNIRLNEDEYERVLKELSIYINDIAGGFTNAIEKSLKSERMKTELITNVSHDIKTPLTSIINYVDLLKKEEIKNPKVKEYLEILDQKSQRLKRLTEDLVEASKASSGNIKLQKEKLNVKELINQISGEFEDKLMERNLDIIISMPEEEGYIEADSRYIYRILENVYSNVVKYALEGSRVYVDVIFVGKEINIQVKNMSKEKLNISTEELMQRFVRGDSSRNTEGSGLGLSIAQSLAELQQGKFEIYLDGDLFKVIITFPKMES